VLQAARRVRAQQLSSVPRRQVQDHGVGWERCPFSGFDGHGMTSFDDNARSLLAEVDVPSVPDEGLDQCLGNRSHASCSVDYAAPG
jgi:hypothetical protein